MKKLLIVSDTHGNIAALESLRPLVAENDYIIHLGDGATDMREIRREYPEKVYQCSGNCDFISVFPEYGILEIEGLRIFYCHGHRFGVKSDLSRLAQETKSLDCDIALYGHTHKALISEIDGVTLINPGALRRKISEGGAYCYLVVHNRKSTPVLVGESVF